MGATHCGGYLQEVLFGLHLVANAGTYLGTSATGEDVLVAKFTRDANQWHGYPFLHTTPSRTVPRHVIDIWWTNGFLRKSQYYRVLRKQPC
jgi:hypothetical protein